MAEGGSSSHGGRPNPKWKWRVVDNLNLVKIKKEMIPNFLGKSEAEAMPQWHEVSGPNLLKI